MASTQLKRKALKNRVRAKKRIDTIKRLTDTPVIKNVDVEKIVEEFEQKAARSSEGKSVKKDVGTPVDKSPKEEAAGKAKQAAGQPVASEKKEEQKEKSASRPAATDDKEEKKEKAAVEAKAGKGADQSVDAPEKAAQTKKSTAKKPAAKKPAAKKTAAKKPKAKSEDSGSKDVEDGKSKTSGKDGGKEKE